MKMIQKVDERIIRSAKRKRDELAGLIRDMPKEMSDKVMNRREEILNLITTEDKTETAMGYLAVSLLSMEFLASTEEENE